MRFAARCLPLLAVAVPSPLTHVAAQRPIQAGDPVRELTPRLITTLDNRSVSEIVSTADGRRFYYTTTDTRESSLWLFEPATKRSKRVSEGEMWDTDLSPAGDQFVFGRTTEDEKVSMVWTLPLNPTTGEPSGPARRLGLQPGDQPRVSPDGKWVAYASYDSADWSAPQHIRVMPASGGAERVVARTKGGITSIRWTPDGQTILFTERDRGPNTPTSTFRVPAAGGTPTRIAGALLVNVPSLSPDGRLILARKVNGSRQDYSLFDLGGTELGTISIPSPFFANVWLNSTTVIATANVAPKTVRLLSLTDGSTKELLPATVASRNLFWSPDGKRVATIGTVSDKTSVIVVNADGSGRQTIVADETRGDNLWWSPDGRFLVSHGSGVVNVIDVARGTAKAIRIQGQAGPMHWRSDSRAIFYTSNPTLPGEQRGIRELTLDGKDRVVRALSIDSQIAMRSDSVAVASTDTGTYLLSAHVGAWTRLASYRPSGAWTDRGAQRIAIRRMIQGGGDHEIEIVDATGKRIARLDFAAFNIGPRATTAVFFHPDGRHIVLAGMANGRRALYLVPIAGGEPRKIADLPDGEAAPAMDLSSDGKHLVFSVAGPASGKIATLDLSSFARR